MANFDGLSERYTSVTQLKDAATSTDSALGIDIFKSLPIKTNLPSDNLGFWLTQGVPTGLIFAHVVMQFVGETDVGICFVPSTKDNQLDKSHIQYITQFCLNQASDHGCVVNGSLKDECRSNVPTLCDMNTTDPGPNNEMNFFDSLYVYRNYVWFLFIFAFVRGVPRILWSLYFAAEIALAIDVTIIFAENGHSGDNLKVKELEKLHKTKGLKKRYLFWYYFARKFVEILLDLAIIGLISAFLTLNNTPYHKLVFVCDLYKDLNNIFLCDIIKTRFISCTVSFGFEFIMTLGMQLSLLVFDSFFQVGFLIYLSCPKCVCKILSCCRSRICCCKSVCTNSKMKEGETNETKFSVTSMYSLNGLHLISMLQKQNCVLKRQKEDKDSSLKMIMVEKMIQDLVEPIEKNTLPSDADEGDQDQNGESTQPEDGCGAQASQSDNNVALGDIHPSTSDEGIKAGMTQQGDTFCYNP